MDTLLFSTDLSDHSHNALKYAIQLCKATNSKMVVFHSSHIPDVVHDEKYEKVVSKAKIYKQDALETDTLNYCIQNHIEIPSSITYEVSNEKNIEEGIMETAAKHKAGLIIVGTHGTTGLKKVVFGSTTAALISKSKIPVLTIPSHVAYHKINTLVYASDMENFSNEIQLLIPFVKSINAEIEVLYLDYWDKGKEKEEQFNKLKKELGISNLHFKNKKVNIDHTMAEHLIAYTEKKKDIVLAMFPEDRNFLEKFFLKSKSQEIMTKLHLPLLTIRK